MILKDCPFCQSRPELTFDTEKNLYKIECKNCIKSGITLICVGEIIEKAVATWNKRWFDDKLLLNKEEYQKFIDIYYYNQKILQDKSFRDLKEEVKLGVTSEMQNNQDSYGYLILKNNEIVPCDLYGHPELLIKLFNLKCDTTNFDHVKFCIENEIIRITIYNNYLSIDLPFQYTNRQIDSVFEALLCYKNTKEMTKFSIFYPKFNSLKVFYTLDEFLTAIDKAKNG